MIDRARLLKQKNASVLRLGAMGLVQLSKILLYRANSQNICANSILLQSRNFFVDALQFAMVEPMSATSGTLINFNAFLSAIVMP